MASRVGRPPKSRELGGGLSHKRDCAEGFLSRLAHHPEDPGNHPRSVLTKVLIAEPREMTADTMALAVNRVRGLVLTSRCSNRGEVTAACAAAPPDVAVLDLDLYEHDAQYAVSSVHERAAMARVLLMAP